MKLIERIQKIWNYPEQEDGSIKPPKTKKVNKAIFIKREDPLDKILRDEN